MTLKDYKLLVNICQQCLRSNNLNKQQIADIDTIMAKLSSHIFLKEKTNALVRNKKVVKRTRVSSS